MVLTIDTYCYDGVTIGRRDQIIWVRHHLGVGHLGPRERFQVVNEYLSAPYISSEPTTTLGTTAGVSVPPWSSFTARHIHSESPSTVWWLVADLVSSLNLLVCFYYHRCHHNSSEPPPTPLLAFFLRYPNPFARHVLSVDVLERTVDPETGKIRTLRLILKRGVVPQWASKWLPAAAASGGRGLDAWVLEESLVDPPGWGGEVSSGADAYHSQPRLVCRQGNLSFKKFMHVIEGGELCAGPNG